MPVPSSSDVAAADTILATQQQQLRDDAVDFWVYLRRASNQVVNNSITLVNDNTLSFTIAANEVWFVELVVMYSATTVADMDIAIDSPSGAVHRFVYLREDQPNSPDAEIGVYSSVGGEIRLDGAGAGTQRAAYFQGVIVNSSTAGTVQVQFAQGTAEVSDARMETNSHLRARRIA
jgi:hypothetical protein